MKNKSVFNKINLKVDKKNTIYSTIDLAVGSIKDTYKHILRNSDISGVRNKIYVMESNLMSLMNEKQKKEYNLKKKLLITFSKQQEHEDIIENLIVEMYMSINNGDIKKIHERVTVMPQLILSPSKKFEKGSLKGYHKRTISSFY
jgi:hypothetical protein